MSFSLGERRCLMLASLLALAVVACVHGGVEHPDRGGKANPEYCASGNSDEQNCMACSSKPGCGYCAVPNGGTPACQPGVGHNARPDTCSQALITSSADCSAPPAPSD